MTETPKLIAIRGLPVPEADGFYATTAQRLGENFNGVLDFAPDYIRGSLQDERSKLADVIGGILKEGFPVAILALSGGAPVAVSTRSILPETDPIAIAAVSGRLNSEKRSGYRTLEEIHERVSPLLADAVVSLDGDDSPLTSAMREKISSYRVEDGDELVHPDMTTLVGALNLNTHVLASNHADGIGKIVWRRRNEIVSFLGGTEN